MPRSRSVKLGLVYLFIVIIAVVVLWRLVPAEVWNALHSTYVNPPTE